MEKNVQLPGGQVVSFPDTMSDDDIANVLSNQAFPSTTAQQPQQKPGAFTRFAQSFGIPTSQQENAGLVQDALQHPEELFPDPGSGAARILRGYGNTVQSNFQDFKGDLRGIASDVNSGANTPVQGVKRMALSSAEQAIKDIPLFGQTLWNYGSDIQQKNYSGAAGGGLGFAAQVAGPKAIETAAGAIPTRSGAGALFNQASSLAGSTPVDVSAAGDIALQARDFASSGGRMPKVLRDFITRATDPNQGPITYSEARSFYQNAGALSANERNGLTPPMQRLVGQFQQKLGAGIQGAADQAGAGQMYRDAMGQYRTLSRMQDFQDWLKTAGTAAVKKGLPIGAGTAAGGYTLYRILDSMRGK